MSAAVTMPVELTSPTRKPSDAEPLPEPLIFGIVMVTRLPSGTLVREHNRSPAIALATDPTGMFMASNAVTVPMLFTVWLKVKTMRWPVPMLRGSTSIAPEMSFVGSIDTLRSPAAPCVYGTTLGGQSAAHHRLGVPFTEDGAALSPIPFVAIMVTL